ncbi:hypothetical protein [Sandaracinobacteroides saxicola]|uniref:Uncharacterized protein n=1 Tax=Sandaracinobacteroides saxicola TaxID=2759707 RepID=A0A7G5IF34_9SPHN|nr:hypothetical protein [Sandaracinobacteroides saxicola]QMW21976.1 hypothetical protein H3309_11380 [Sandaracinobacteroides saxicola]
MTRILKLVYVAAIAYVLLTFLQDAINPNVIFFERIGSKSSDLKAIGWIISALFPIMLSIIIWKLIDDSRFHWILHVLFFPCAFMIYHVGASILFFAAGVPDGDSIEGYALLPAFAVLLLTSLVHGAALVAWCVMRMRRRSKTE